ncbi:MAG: SEC-C metal-binding domain-containing protein, partial [bacterium]
EEETGSDNMRHLEQIIMLQVIDGLWKDHLYAMDHLKEGIGLRGYGQKDPKIEYQREGYDMFTELVERIKEDSVKFMFTVQGVEAAEEQESRRRRKVEQQTKPKSESPVRKKAEEKTGRNDPCPCGSGKKHKKCCGK